MFNLKQQSGFDPIGAEISEITTETLNFRLLFGRVGSISTTMKTIQPWAPRMVVSFCLFVTLSATASA
jgi:hypothetical protein